MGGEFIRLLIFSHSVNCCSLQASGATLFVQDGGKTILNDEADCFRQSRTARMVLNSSEGAAGVRLDGAIFTRTRSYFDLIFKKIDDKTLELIDEYSGNRDIVCTVLNWMIMLA